MTKEEKLHMANRHLNEKIDHYKNEDYFVYNETKNQCSYHHCKNINKPKSHVCFNFFEEWSDIIKYSRDTSFEVQEPEQNFDYYLLIKKSYYKEFKKENPEISDFKKLYTSYKIFPTISKFTKDYYNKKNVVIDGIDCIRLKLRFFNNTFTPHFMIYISKSSKLKSIKLRYSLRIMAKSVKKKYSSLVTIDNNNDFNYWDVDLDECDQIKISDDTILYLVHDKFSDIFYNMLENFIIFGEKKYFDTKEYFLIFNNAILKNERKNIELHLSITGYINQRKNMGCIKIIK